MCHTVCWTWLVKISQVVSSSTQHHTTCATATCLFFILLWCVLFLLSSPSPLMTFEFQLSPSLHWYIFILIWFFFFNFMVHSVHALTPTLAYSHSNPLARTGLHASYPHVHIQACTQSCMLTHPQARGVAVGCGKFSFPKHFWLNRHPLMHMDTHSLSHMHTCLHMPSCSHIYHSHLAHVPSPTLPFRWDNGR